MVKLLETFFRHKLLLLLPPILIPLLVGPPALLTAPLSYETYAGVWVDKPTYLNYTSDWNSYITPAQNQAGRLNEVLKTRTFLDDVARRTSLAPLVGNTRGEERISTIIIGGLTVVPGGGNHLLVLRFRGDNAQLSYQILNAIVDAFRDNTANDRMNQAALATSFYQSQLDTAQQSLSKAQDALQQYLAVSPAGKDPSSAPNSAGELLQALGTQNVDPQLTQLQHDVDFARSQVEHQKSALDQATFDASASLEGSDLGFQVLDAPTVPTTPIRQTRARIIFPVAGLVAGMILSALLLVLLMASDRAVRSESDLPSNLRFLGGVPSLTLKRLPKRAGPNVTRRAIGFVAGAALPLPSGTTK
jgi:uncharacterized protein involved in exopolysaccharide biosynthesis